MSGSLRPCSSLVSVLFTWQFDSFVILGAYVSETHGTEYGIPQRSILGPICFHYMLMVHNCTSLSRQMTPMHCMLSLPVSLALMYEWVKNLLKLNKAKTDILLIGPKAAREKLHSMLGGLSKPRPRLRF